MAKTLLRRSPTAHDSWEESTADRSNLSGCGSAIEIGIAYVQYRSSPSVWS
jgi:hypothetical protein